MKKWNKKRFKKAAVLLLVFCLLFLTACGQSGNREGGSAAADAPMYICYEGLDWGMSPQDCFEVLDIDVKEMSVSKSKNHLGIESAMYYGRAKTYGIYSNISLWFNSYAEGEEEGLSSLVIANGFYIGEQVEPKVKAMFERYTPNFTLLESERELPTAEFPTSSEMLLYEPDEEWERSLIQDDGAQTSTSSDISSDTSSDSSSAVETGSEVSSDDKFIDENGILRGKITKKQLEWRAGEFSELEKQDKGFTAAFDELMARYEVEEDRRPDGLSKALMQYLYDDRSFRVDMYGDAACLSNQRASQRAKGRTDV